MPGEMEAAPPSAGRSEADELQLKASQVTDEHIPNYHAHAIFLPQYLDEGVPGTRVNESLESTRRMMALCEESKEAGIRTLVALDDQGEQLERIEQGMHQINADMREAEENLAGMEKCCGLCVLPWQRSANFKENEGTWKNQEDGKMVSNQPMRVTDERNGAMVNSGYIGRVTKDAREDEMEENMQQVSGMLSNLRNMAMDMNSEIDNQNNQISRITNEGDSNYTRIRIANERADKLMK